MINEEKPGRLAREGAGAGNLDARAMPFDLAQELAHGGRDHAEGFEISLEKAKQLDNPSGALPRRHELVAERPGGALHAVENGVDAAGIGLAPGAHRRDDGARGLGGLAGVALGYGITVAWSAYREWEVLVPQIAILGGLGAALVIGSLAGFYPAIRASRMSPTEALRSA